ncbi:hypothetical protein GCM10009554_75850 [Kribbella koreensis]|uniref:Uncharacterized protein n=1 Tax=Kribbella koreensis TaxID=57909 RepID=A0ABP4C6G7_9ACTN
MYAGTRGDRIDGEPVVTVLGQLRLDCRKHVSANPGRPAAGPRPLAASVIPAFRTGDGRIGGG